MIRYKKNSGNKWKIPTLKAEMQKKWLAVRNNTSPHVSPSNSDDEESLGGDDKSYSTASWTLRMQRKWFSRTRRRKTTTARNSKEEE